MTLVDIHARLSTTALMYIAFLGLWALLRFFRKEGVNANFWGALVIAELLLVVQGLLGGYLALSGSVPARPIHYLYGILSVILIPAVFGLTHGRDERRDILAYGASLLFLAGMLLRAIGTG